MPAKSNTTAAVEQTQEPKYVLEKLRANSIKIFGISTSTFDGAFYGHNEKEYTINEAKAIINKWLGKEN